MLNQLYIQSNASGGSHRRAALDLLRGLGSTSAGSNALTTIGALYAVGQHARAAGQRAHLQHHVNAIEARLPPERPVPPSATPSRFSAFSHFETTTEPLSINHQGQFPAITVSFNLAPNASLGGAISAIDKVQQDLHMPASLQADFQGTAASFRNSLSNEPLLILAALVTVYIVLGVLYESFIHPITILSTLPSAGVGAFLALILFHQDLSVVAIIGIVLLIGIVKKNGIMMVDFALEAEREQRQRLHRSHLRSLPAAFPADHDDHHGRAARRTAARVRHAASARNCAVRWASPWSADCLSARCSRSTRRRSFTSFSTISRSASRASHRSPKPRSSVHASLRTSAGGAGMNISAPFIRRPVATTLLTVAIAIAGAIAFNVLPVSPLPQVDFPTISVSASLARSQRGDHGLLRRHAAGAAVRPHRRRHGDDLREQSRHHLHHHPVRPQPQYRRRGARRRSRHQRRAHLSAGQPARAIPPIAK